MKTWKDEMGVEHDVIQCPPAECENCHLVVPFQGLATRLEIDTEPLFSHRRKREKKRACQ